MTVVRIFVEPADQYSSLDDAEYSVNAKTWTSDLQELTPMKKEQADLENKVVWIPDSKTPNGVAEVPLTDLAVEALRDQMPGSAPTLGGRPDQITRRK